MTRTRFIEIVGGGVFALTPLSASAAQTFKEIVNGPIVRIGDTLIYLLYSLAFLFFVYGMFKYFFTSGANAEENRREGRQFMVWAIIGLVVLFCVWGIVRLFLGLLQSWA